MILLYAKEIDVIGLEIGKKELPGRTVIIHGSTSKNLFSANTIILGHRSNSDPLKKLSFCDIDKRDLSLRRIAQSS
jgi:hypothetical protein